MCAMIAMCAYCTEENGKFKYLKETLKSLIGTVDFRKHRLFIINNSTFTDAKEFLHDFKRDCDCEGLSIRMHFSDTNLGTAEGINLAIKERRPDEIVIKCDDDWTTDVVGWVDEMERVMTEHPEIGILGLRRDDVYGELIEDGEVLWNSDIFGTCTMFNPKMLDKVGRMIQFSEYGYDDCIYSVRSEAAGFKNAFMKNIRIVNLDEGGTEYTEWKKREAKVYQHEASILMDKIKCGELSYYFPFE